MIDELSIQVSNLEEQLDQHQNSNSELADEIEEERSRVQTIASDLDRARSELQSLKGRHASLEALQKASLVEGAPSQDPSRPSAPNKNLPATF